MNKDDIQIFLPKTFLFFNLKDFIFYKFICNMYFFADIKSNCRKSRFIIEQRRLLKNVKTKNLYICKMYILADILIKYKNSRFIYEQRRLLKKIYKQKVRIFLFKRFYSS